MKLSFFLETALAILVFSSLCCHFHYQLDQNVNSIDGSGVEAVQTRSVADYSKIEIDAAVDVEVSVGGKGGILSVSGDDNIVSLIRAEVNGDLLRIFTESPSSIHPRRPLLIRAGTPRLDRVVVSGAGEVDVEGLQNEKLEIQIDGAGDVELAGQTQDLWVWIDGAGDVKAFGLKAQNAEVRINGAGDVALNAASKLNIQIQGAGDVRYKGAPAVTQSIAGAGDVEKVD